MERFTFSWPANHDLVQTLNNTKKNWCKKRNKETKNNRNDWVHHVNKPPRISGCELKDGRTDGRVVANNYGRRSINMEDGNTFAKGMTEKIRLLKKKNVYPTLFLANHPMVSILTNGFLWWEYNFRWKIAQITIYLWDQIIRRPILLVKRRWIKFHHGNLRLCFG